MLDRLVIVVALTGGCIRIGNLINSEIIGKPTDLPWAFVFKQFDNQPRHPGQLYEAIFCFILFVILFFVWKNRRQVMYNGMIFGIFLITLFGQRFLVEFVKENQVPFEDSLALNMGQILSIPLVLIGFYVLYYSFTKKERRSTFKGEEKPVTLKEEKAAH
jgi:prolipoprotein diacylglyceryltransferase